MSTKSDFKSDKQKVDFSGFSEIKNPKDPEKKVMTINALIYYDKVALAEALKKKGEQNLKWGRSLYKNLPFIFGHINEKALVFK